MRSRIHFAASAAIVPVLVAACATSSGPAAGPQAAAPVGTSITSVQLSSAQNAWVAQTLRGLSLRDKVGQLLTVWIDGSYVPFGGPEYERLRSLVQDLKVGGIVMSVGPPLEIAAKLNMLQRLASVPLLVSADVERGPAQRLANATVLPYGIQTNGATEFPPIMAIGATRNERLAYEVGRITAREVRAVGIHMAYAPVVDVNSNPANPIINTRSYSEDPQLVAKLAAAHIRGLQEHGVFATAKHFPGHGDTETDSHMQLPFLNISRARADSVELVPFRAAVAAGVAGVMIAHIAFPGLTGDSIPATISPALTDTLLHHDLGFAGVTISDALDMDAIAARFPGGAAAVRAIQSGTDVLLMPRDPRLVLDAVVAAVQSGQLTEARIDASVRRILEMKARAGLMQQRLVSLDSVQRFVAAPEHAAVARELAEKAIVVVRDSARVFPLTRPDRQILSIIYSAEIDPFVGRPMQRELSARFGAIRTVFMDNRTRPEELDSLITTIQPNDVVLFSAFVRVVDRRGSVAIPERFGRFINAVNERGRLALLTFGNPYLLLQVPGVKTYALGWGTEDVAQTAMVRALVGQAAVSGKLPISLPPHYRIGDGLSIPAQAQ